DLDELHQAAIGNIELTVEIKRARIAVGAVFGNLAIVDIAGQLGRVLILLVLWLEGANADAVLLAEDQAIDLDLLGKHAGNVAVVPGQALVEHIAAVRAQFALNLNLGPLGITARVQLVEYARAQILRDQAKRVAVHRVFKPSAVLALPGKGKEHAVVGAR